MAPLECNDGCDLVLGEARRPDTFDFVAELVNLDKVSIDSRSKAWHLATALTSKAVLNTEFRTDRDERLLRGLLWELRDGCSSAEVGPEPAATLHVPRNFFAVVIDECRQRVAVEIEIGRTLK